MVRTDYHHFMANTSGLPSPVKIFDRRPGRLSFELTVDGSDNVRIMFGTDDNTRFQAVCPDPNNPVSLTAIDLPGLIEEEIWITHNSSGCNVWALEVFCLPCSE